MFGQTNFLAEATARQIVQRAMSIISHSVNVMDSNGVIIASGNPSRLFQRHEGAVLALTENRVVEIDNVTAEHLKGVRPGINLPFSFRNQRVGVIGISGEPTEVRAYAELVKMAAELTQHAEGARPGFAAAISAPLVAILLLSLRPIAGIAVDPLIALPVGGLAGALLMGLIRQCNQFMVSGLSRMAPVAIMLLGTGPLAGIIANSALKDVLITGLTHTGLTAWLLAPLSGALMSMATASTTAGTAVASGVFSSTLLELGVSGLAGAAMIHAGATVLDHLLHGSFFHATGGSVNMAVHERLKLLPYETLVGFTIAAVSALMLGVFNLAG